MKEQIQNIHKSDLFGIIVESGCAATLAHSLMTVAGSSATIFMAKQPYSKDYQHCFYGEHGRSVSMEMVEHMMKTEMYEILSDVRTKLNFGITTSWQMGEGDVVSHGWYCVLHNGKMHKLHYTIPASKATSREKILEIIAEIGVNILSALHGVGIQELQFIKSPAVLDQAYDNDGNIDYELLIGTLEHQDFDYPLVFMPHDGPIRFEDLMRRNNEFIIQKGSFNPLHHQHVHMMDAVGDLHPKALQAFLISTFRYDKPHIDPTELTERIKNINKHNYPVIICKEIYFYETFKLFKIWAKSHPDNLFYFPVGTDTINRIYKTDLEKNVSSPFKAKVFIDGMVRIWSKNFKLVVLPRSEYELFENYIWYDGLATFISSEDYQDDGTSSTKIRSGEIKNKLG